MYNLIILFIALVINVLVGLIFKDYQWENVGFSSAVLLFNSLFLHIIGTVNLKDSFKISLFFILPLLGIIELILAIIAPTSFSNNIYLMGIIGIIAFQIIIFLLVNLVSQKIE